MADENEPIPDAPGDEPTPALDAVPDEPTVTLDIVQLTSDEPEGGGNAAAELTEVITAPQPPAPDRQKQLTIALAATAAVVLVAAALTLVLTRSDGSGTSTGLTAITSASDPVSTSTSTAPTSTPSSAASTTAATQVPEPIGPTPLFTLAGSTFAFSHDGSRIATSSNDDPTTIWDLRSGRSLVTIDDRGYRLAFTPDDRLLVSTAVEDEAHGYYGYSHSFAVADGRQVAEFLPYRSLSADGRYMIGSESGVVEFLDVNTGELATSFSLPGEPIFNWETSPDGRHILFVHGNQFNVAVGDVTTGEVLYPINAPVACSLGNTAFSSDGRFIVVDLSCPYGGGASTMLLDTATGDEVLRLAGVQTVALSADGSQILTTGTSSEGLGTLRVWDTATGQLLHTLALPSSITDHVPDGFDPELVESGFTPGAFSNDGKRIVATFSTMDAGSLAVVWDVASEAVVFHAWGLQFSELSPDGTMIAGIGFGVEVFRI